jgi:hypothetical protein
MNLCTAMMCNFLRRHSLKKSLGFRQHVVERYLIRSVGDGGRGGGGREGEWI